MRTQVRVQMDDIGRGSGNIQGKEFVFRDVVEMLEDAAQGVAMCHNQNVVL